MTIHMTPIDSMTGPAARAGTTMPTTASLQRAVKAGSEALGGANNYAAQNTVQTRQNAETVKQTNQMLNRKITTATLAALTPAGSAHDEDEADKEREQDAFGADYPYGAPHRKSLKPTKKTK